MNQDFTASSSRVTWTLGGAALGALGAYGLLRRTPAAWLLAAAGLALLARGTTNVPFAPMAGRGVGKRSIDLQKTIHIEAVPERVFDLWSNYENFPRFMSHVQQVRDLGNGRSHWVVEGPAGTQVEWNAETMESRRPEVLAWRSMQNATVDNSGTIRFEPEGSGTRVTVQLSYRPPAGRLGHAVASLFGKDPKQQMDDDLMRMKQFIETGIPPKDAAQTSTATLH